MEIESSSFTGTLSKMGIFIAVQALVYIILSNSSNIFSKTRPRSTTIKSIRSISIRRIEASLADLPIGEPLSPPPHA
ncbi:hypothetical protein Leryth_019093 [Lithospermum erythrorhizon]|nr:hypothetical protein Leryth_019093 [Lithospermum erythrorhizon]